MPNANTKPVVLCATDFSEGSEAAIVQAADYAERLRGRLHLIHSDPAILSSFGEAEEKQLRMRILHERTREFASKALGGQNVLDVIGPEIVIRQGVYAGDAILAYADELGADYIIIGTHGLRGIERFLVGSVAEYVVRRASCPVLTVPHAAARSHPGPSSPVLVPVDFSEHSRVALEQAKAMSGKLGARVELIHVLEDTSPLPAFYPAGGLIPVQDLPTFHDFADDHLRQLDAEVGGEPAAGFSVRAGRPHKEIPAYAEEIGAGLIVMATHGLTGIKHALMGSVTERTLRYATCPVLSISAREK